MTTNNFNIKGTCKDVVITIIHNKINKVRTQPGILYSDEEFGLKEIADEISKKTGVTIIINNTTFDLNNKNDFIDNSKVLNEVKEIIEKINPKVVIDLHGMSDKGTLFNNAVNNGMRLFREFVEKPIPEEDRPEVDIEVRRKASVNSMTAKGSVVKELARCLVLNGLKTDIEAVFPGGQFIADISSINRDVIAIEVTSKVRKKKSEAFINSIINFIQIIRGEVVDIKQVPLVNVEKEIKEIEKKDIEYKERVDRYVG